MTRIVPTKVEVFFEPHEIIVSKTDPRGRITYANEVFCRIAGYEARALIGQPHSIIRHPDMPRAVFKLLWDHLAEGQEVFAYVKNMARSGAFYWVFAHVTPSYDAQGALVGYHSSRRVPDRAAITRIIEPLYAELLREEAAETNAKAGLERSYRHLQSTFAAKGMRYDELIFAL